MNLKNILKVQTGFTHIIIILLGIIVLSAIGGATYAVVMKKNGKKVDHNQTARKYDDQRVDNKVLNDLKGSESDE